MLNYVRIVEILKFKLLLLEFFTSSSAVAASWREIL